LGLPAPFANFTKDAFDQRDTRRTLRRPGAAGITFAAEAGIEGGALARPYYGNDAGILDNTTSAVTTAGGYGGFLDGGPGDVEIRVLPGVGQSRVHSTRDPFGDGWAMGDVEQPAGDIVRMRTRPGALAFAFAFCDVE
jgi:hypothetical protein